MIMALPSIAATPYALALGKWRFGLAGGRAKKLSSLHRHYALVTSSNPALSNHSHSIAHALRGACSAGLLAGSRLRLDFRMRYSSSPCPFPAANPQNPNGAAVLKLVE